MIFHILSSSGQFIILENVGFSKMSKTTLLSPMRGTNGTLVYYQTTNGGSGWLNINSHVQYSSAMLLPFVSGSNSKTHFRFYYELDDGTVYAVDVVLFAAYGFNSSINFVVSSHLLINRMSITIFLHDPQVMTQVLASYD